MEEKEGIPPVQQRLIFGGKQMADDKTIAEYSIEGSSKKYTNHLFLRFLYRWIGVTFGAGIERWLKSNPRLKSGDWLCS